MGIEIRTPENENGLIRSVVVYREVNGRDGIRKETIPPVITIRAVYRKEHPVGEYFVFFAQAGKRQEEIGERIHGRVSDPNEKVAERVQKRLDELAQQYLESNRRRAVD